MLPQRTQPAVVCVAQVKSTVNDPSLDPQIFSLNFASRKSSVSLEQSRIIHNENSTLTNESLLPLEILPNLSWLLLRSDIPLLFF